MKAITINLSDYVTEEEMKEVVIEEYRRWFKSMTETDKLRILSNFSYEFMFKEINDSVDGKLREIVHQKATDTINKADFNYFMFRPANAWDREESVAVTVINEVVKSKRNVIEEKIDAALEKLNAKDFKQWILRFSTK